jgi:ribosomal protein S5
LGKSKDVSEAIAKAVEDAKKNLVKIPLNGLSVPHEQKGKFGGACILNSCVTWYRILLVELFVQF